MTTVLRVLLGRVIGALVAALAALLFTNCGVTLDAAQQAEVVEGFIILLMTIFTIVYGIVHKLVNKKLNPGDTASATLADRSVLERERIG